MKLLRLHIEKPAAIPGYTAMAGGVDTRLMDFDAAEGWELTLDGDLLRVQHTTMERAVTLRGYACSFVEAPPPPPEEKLKGSLVKARQR